MHFKILFHLSAVLVLLIIVTGCERKTQYKILTTVFTGVPPMEELYGDDVKEEKATLEGSAELSQKTLFQHPLWLARQCSACHEISADSKMKKVESGNSAHQELHSSNGIAPELILPAKKLCISCHRDKTARRAIRDRLWLHNPVARGDCLSCHSKHQSFNQAHLQQSLNKICSSCHVSGQLPLECLAEPVTDQTESNCFTCHNAHMGRDRFLLKRDYREVKIPAGPVPEPANP